MIAVINCGSTKAPVILDRIIEADHTGELISMESLDGAPDEKFSAIVISGAPILLTETDPDPYLARFQWLKREARPVLGICFGHQVMGMLHGSRIYATEEDRADQSIYHPSGTPLWDDLPNPAVFQEDHCEAITLPDGFQPLGSSEVSVVEAMAHPTKPHYGVQFHPEVSGENGRLLFRNFLEICAKHSS